METNRQTTIAISTEYPYTHKRQSTNLPAQALAPAPTNLRASHPITHSCRLLNASFSPLDTKVEGVQ
ncbi:hypothetical protein I352_04222 [Cryptococcus deuterogattii MMRL2647]|nr:hypothetical protein I352_04222 [Cryptococcus deuterogattii MMRL2647]